MPTIAHDTHAMQISHKSTTLLILHATKLETTRETTLEFEMMLPASRSTTPKEDRLATRPMPKRTALEGILLLLLIVGIIASIKPRFQLWITQHLVSLIDCSHFLLRILFLDALVDGLVRVKLAHHFAIGRLDLTFIGVTRETKNFVVVFGFGAFEEGLGVLQHGLEFLGAGVVFLGLVEGGNGLVELVRVNKLLRLVEETR
jgi:hypothetical protein